MKRLIVGWFALVASAATVPAGAAALTFEQRVVAQQAIERIYHEYRVGDARSFGEAVPLETVEAKVRDYLGMSAALDEIPGESVTARSLAAELERIARQTRFPERLERIYAALGRDPLLLQECLARPTLVARRLRARHDRGESDFESWWSEARERFDSAAVAAVAAVADAGIELPLPFRGGESWVPVGVSSSAPPARDGHTAVWTGSEMIVWGGGFLRSGGFRYDPALDLPAAEPWSGTSLVAAPAGRRGHTAVWTGDEMIVWGGFNGSFLDDGARYDPLDGPDGSWTPVTDLDAPRARRDHTAVWTGSEMIVWGGVTSVGATATGGRYDPLTNSWTPTNDDVATAPPPRSGHAAVWTGSEMIVWGGTDFNGFSVRTGGRYDPVADEWSPVSLDGAPPTPRRDHTAVWTGGEMIVFGGRDAGFVLSTGAAYDPTADRWRELAKIGAPADRADHTAVWTGNEMVVWGGTDDGPLADGGRYDPVADAWQPVAVAPADPDAPSPRTGHIAVWTGAEMIVWGGVGDGVLDGGGRYAVAGDSWEPVRASDAPTGRIQHTAVWTGTEMIVWGGINFEPTSTGGRYDPLTNSWTPTSQSGAPEARTGHTAIWTGTEMIVWGGTPLSGDGARYDPLTDSWAPLNESGAPSPRRFHSAVWTGTEMIVWGGFDGRLAADGARYDPVTDGWTRFDKAPEGTLSARSGHAALWTGSKMLVYGGSPATREGAQYTPSDDSWESLCRWGAPRRTGATQVWTGNELIVWGGSAIGIRGDGYRVDPSIQTCGASTPWSALGRDGETPAARRDHTAVWTGDSMIVWGGSDGVANLASGGSYDPAADRWSATTTAGAPESRRGHTAVWTGSAMIVWGGIGDEFRSDGGVYTPAPAPLLHPGVTPQRLERIRGLGRRGLASSGR